MVGLSVLLDKSSDTKCISKTNMIKSPSSSSESSNRNKDSNNPFSRNGGFLECCFLCKLKLSPGKDIYMYKGDRAFCSEECRCRQIFMDEEETVKGKTHDYCSVASTSARRKGAKNQEKNGFVY